MLIRCAQAAAVTLVPGKAAPLAAGVEFHLHPEYRERSPLEPVLRNRTASFDDFVLEKYHDQIAAILARWTAGLLQSSQRTRAIEKSLAPGFHGASFQISGTKMIRRDPHLEVRQLSFNQQTLLEAEAFVRELQKYLHDNSNILTAEFEVKRISGTPVDGLETQIRYEFVGEGPGFYREQRAGTWGLSWQNTAAGEYAVEHWQHLGETRSRSLSPCYQDLTRHAFGSNHSYSAQLIHGVDYWRTVLDSASRIDIYGHNGVSVGDVDGNGLDDLYIGQPAGIPNRLYRNRGDGTFEGITDESAVGVLENTACALFADFSNSGHQDLVVVRANGPLLFLNDGDGKFREKPDAFRFTDQPQGTFHGCCNSRL